MNYDGVLVEYLLSVKKESTTGPPSTSNPSAAAETPIALLALPSAQWLLERYSFNMVILFTQFSCMPLMLLVVKLSMGKC